MTILQNLDFVSSNLAVSYRASHEPQILQISISLEEAASDSAVPVLIDGFVDEINAGGAGGAEFSPCLGKAVILEGVDLGDEGEEGPDYTYKLEVRGVSPLYMRNIVDAMIAASGVTKVRALTIVGQLLPDHSPFTVHEQHVKAWLDDPTAYLGQWPNPGFRITDNRLTRGMNLRVEFKEQMSDEAYRAVCHKLLVWQNLIQLYVDLSGKDLGKTDGSFHHGRTSTEFLTSIMHFNYARRPARDALINLFVRVHEQVAPITDVEIGMV